MPSDKPLHEPTAVMSASDRSALVRRRLQAVAALDALADEARKLGCMAVCSAAQSLLRALPDIPAVGADRDA